MVLEQQPLAPRRGPVVLLLVMAALFVVLVSIMVGGFRTWSEETRPATAPASTATRPSPPPLPIESGFESRNLVYGGNLATIVAEEGKPLDGGWFPESVARVAADLERLPAEELERRSKPIPPFAELLARPLDYAGETLSLRVVPFASHPHKRFLAGGETRDTWRVYAMMQRDTSEVVLLESFERPPHWTEMRDAYEAVGVFLRTGTYSDEKGNARRVPYLLAKSYRPLEGVDTGPSVGLHRLLFSRYGGLLAAAVVAFVVLTVWTLRRFARRQEKLERDSFYALLRAKKRPVKKAP
jgi:hypothetical protein